MLIKNDRINQTDCFKISKLIFPIYKFVILRPKLRKTSERSKPSPAPFLGLLISSRVTHPSSRTGSSVVEQLTADQRVTGSIPVQSFFYFSLNFNNISCNLPLLTFSETSTFEIWKLQIQSISSPQIPNFSVLPQILKK